MSIDCHAHYYPPEYLEAVAGLVDEPGAVGAVARFTTNHPLVKNDPMYSGLIDERIAMMDAAKIDTHVLSWAAPNVWHPDSAARSRLVRTFNDACLAIADQHPGRFKLFANVPLPHLDATIAESDHMLAQPDVVGIGMCTHVDGAPINDARFQPVFEHWNEQGTTVVFHPDGFCAPNVLSDLNMEWSLGAPFDDTIVTMRLLYGGMVKRYPNISWIVPHLGGTFPFLLGRLDFMWHLDPSVKARMDAPPSESFDRVYFDTVTPQAESIALTAKMIGTEHMVLGSDFPYASRADLNMGPRLLGEAGLSDAEQQAVLHGNIAPKLGLG